MALEVVHFRPERQSDTLVVITSGFMNDTDYVRDLHEDAARVWAKQGHNVTAVHPDWPYGDLRETVDTVTNEVRDWVRVSPDRFAIAAGSSAAGQPTLHAGLEIATDTPDLIDRTAYTTICSRHDLTGVNVPQLEEVSPMLVRMIVSLGSERSKKGLALIAPRTRSMTAGTSDRRVPDAASVLPGAERYDLPRGLPHAVAIENALQNQPDQIVVHFQSRGRR